MFPFSWTRKKAYVIHSSAWGGGGWAEVWQWIWGSGNFFKFDFSLQILWIFDKTFVKFIIILFIFNIVLKQNTYPMHCYKSFERFRWMWRYCKALCGLKFSQIEGNSRQFRPIELSNRTAVNLSNYICGIRHRDLDPHFMYRFSPRGKMAPVPRARVYLLSTPQHCPPLLTARPNAALMTSHHPISWCSTCGRKSGKMAPVVHALGKLPAEFGTKFPRFVIIFFICKYF